MKRYWKGSDMRLDINITDKKGEEIPLSSIMSMTIYLFTTGKEYVEYNYPQSILEDDKGLYIPINENALAYLPDGLLRWEANFKVKDIEWPDGRDIVKSCQTDIFVKTPRDYVAKPNVQEKEITLTENGEYEVLPDAGYEGISRMTINVEIPFPLEEKEITLTENGEYEVLPDTGYKGIGRVNVNVDFDVQPYYEEGFKKFLKKEASGKIELPIEAMNTPNCLYGQTGITEVVVHEGTTGIPDNFFRGCTSLEKITYPDSITSFGDDIYGNIDYEKIMSFPLPPYLNSSGNGNIYYRGGEIFNVPKYINQIAIYGNPSFVGSYNDGIAKRLNFKGNLCRFYFQSFRAEEVDFRYNVQIPTFDYTSIYTGMTKVIVPESLYDTWITTSPWSDYAAITESVPDTDYFIPYQTKSGNDIALTTGVKEDRYAVISSSDKKILLKGTPWRLNNIIFGTDITYIDFAASNLEVPDFTELFRGATQMTGCTLPVNKPFIWRNMFENCTSLTTAPEIDTTNATDMYGMFYSCSSLSTIPALNTSSVTNMGAMFNDCTSLTTIPEMDTSNVTDMGAMFFRCTSLSTIPALNTSSVTNMRAMFEYCSSLTTVPEMETSNLNDTYDMFWDCRSLTDLGGFKGLKCNLDLSPCPALTHDSLMNVINKAADVTSSPKTLTLGATNLAKLSDAEKAIATGKGWTLA